MVERSPDEMAIESDVAFTRQLFLSTLTRLLKLYFTEPEAVKALEVLLRVSGGEPMYLGDYNPPRYGLFGITTPAAGLEPRDGFLLWNPIRNVAWAAKLYKAYGWQWWTYSLPDNRDRAKGKGGK